MFANTISAIQIFCKNNIFFIFLAMRLSSDFVCLLTEIYMLSLCLVLGVEDDGCGMFEGAARAVGLVLLRMSGAYAICDE